MATLSNLLLLGPPAVPHCPQVWPRSRPRGRPTQRPPTEVPRRDEATPRAAKNKKKDPLSSVRIVAIGSVAEQERWTNARAGLARPRARVETGSALKTPGLTSGLA